MTYIAYFPLFCETKLFLINTLNLILQLSHIKSLTKPRRDKIRIKTKQHRMKSISLKVSVYVYSLYLNAKIFVYTNSLFRLQSFEDSIS